VIFAFADHLEDSFPLRSQFSFAGFVFPFHNGFRLILNPAVVKRVQGLGTDEHGWTQKKVTQSADLTLFTSSVFVRVRPWLIHG
jgi:hypothetical protein